MKKKQTIWSKMKTLLITVALTVGVLLIVGATRVNPPPLFPEFVMGQVDDAAVEMAAAGDPSVNLEPEPSFFSIVQIDDSDEDDNELFDFLTTNEQTRDGKRAKEGADRRR